MKKAMSGLRVWKVGLAAFVVASVFCAGSAAHAQYSSGFSYFNPRTGFGYSQGWIMGPSSYLGGFSVVTPRYGFSTYNGYAPGRYISGMRYGNRRGVYSQGWYLAPGRYRITSRYLRTNEKGSPRVGSDLARNPTKTQEDCHDECRT